MSLYDSIEKIKDGVGDPFCDRNRKLIDLVQFIAEQGRPYFVGGGFALVFSYGKIYRCHGDVDLFFLPEDKNFWLSKISSRGIALLENLDRSGKPIVRMVGTDERWMGDIKFVSKGDLAEDGLPHRVQTNHIGQWVIPTHDPEYNQWQKNWMISKGEDRQKDWRDLERYFV
jgi:hypothetical protein